MSKKVFIIVEDHHWAKSYKDGAYCISVKYQYNNVVAGCYCDSEEKKDILIAKYSSDLKEENKIPIVRDLRKHIVPNKHQESYSHKL